MFLVGPDGRIEGRMLDAESASTLLHSVLAANNPYYDLSPVLELYDYVFSSIGDTLTRQDIAMVRSTARRSTIAGGIDTLSYKQMTAGLMQWLLQRTGPAAYEGLLDVCVEDVLAVDVWTGANDTLEVVNPARLFASIRSLCPIGGKLPRFVVKTEGGCKRLSKLKDVYVMFYDPSCSSCKEKLAVYKDRAVFVNIEAQSRRIKKRMLKSIDLSILPMIFKTDSEGLIVERAL